MTPWGRHARVPTAVASRQCQLTDAERFSKGCRARAAASLPHLPVSTLHAGSKQRLHANPGLRLAQARGR
jgi:hypothetical protein